MLLETCGCGFDPAKYHGDEAHLRQPCATHKDVPLLIGHVAWANITANQNPAPTPKAKVVETKEKLNIDDTTAPAPQQRARSADRPARPFSHQPEQ